MTKIWASGATSRRPNPFFLIMLSISLGTVLSVGVALGRTSTVEAWCPANFVCITDHTFGTIGSDDIGITAKAQQRGLYLPEPAWTCVNGGVENDADSTLTAMSYEGRKWESSILKDTWEGSCVSCAEGSSKDSHDSWFVYGIGVGPEIQVNGQHQFVLGSVVTRLYTSITHNWP